MQADRQFSALVPDMIEAHRELHILITGEVKRVRFRLFTRDLALKHGLTGWVRNRRNSVEIKAQGEIQSLRKFLEEVASGPPSARVRSVETDWDRPSDEARQFRIRWFYLF